MKVMQTINCRTLDNSQEICSKVKKLLDANCECVRINLKNFTDSDIKRVDKLLRCIAKVDKELKLKIAIDIPASKAKYRLHIKEAIEFQKGVRFIICKSNYTIDEALKAYIDESFFENIKNIKTGDILYWGDGEGKLKIVDKYKDHLEVRTENDFYFYDNKSISRFYKSIKLDNKQKNYLTHIIENYNITLIFLSFCETVTDVEYFKKLYPQLLICSKIETQLGIDNIDEILSVSDGIMIARGDLMLNTPLNHFLNTQNYLAQKTVSSNKKLFIATDILTSMNKQELPSRSDLCDIELITSYSTSGIILKASFFHNNRFSLVMDLINRIIEME